MGSDREGTCRPVGLAAGKNMRAGAVGVYICRAVWVEGREWREGKGAFAFEESNIQLGSGEKKRRRRGGRDGICAKAG